MILLEVVVHSLCANSIPMRGFFVVVFLDFLSTEKMVLHVLETLNWHRRRIACPPRPLPDDYQDLCPNFALSDAEEAACDFRIPGMVQAIFYTMVVNDAWELDVLSKDLAEDLKSTLVGLRWCTFEAWLQHNKNSLLQAHLGPVSPGVRAGPVNGHEESTVSNEASPPPEHRLARTKTNVRLKTILQLMVKGYSEGNSHSTSYSCRLSIEVCTTSAAPAQGERSTLEEKYLLPAVYKFIIPNPDATINESPPGCIVIYQVAFCYGLRFPLHMVIVEILNKYELAPAQVVPMSWHNVCSFIATCELRGLSCIGWAFRLIHTIQKASSETKDTGWYSFNNRKGFMMAIGKKPKLKD
ncbi:hypothetical protein Cgig2_013685 [Carnegiea gigantea]|uniref:Uncharacterized protein n=1 Tax=Carnegiea gigantea TaxID=171969 RepID=A0A9Q1QI79_9CARY|nr:hypothetical protein Cgig2_013685 [Carnegiea gigantea]